MPVGQQARQGAQALDRFGGRHGRQVGGHRQRAQHPMNRRHQQRVVPARAHPQQQGNALRRIRAIQAEHRGHHLGQRQHAPQRTDLLAGQRARIARPVHPFVVLEHRTGHVPRVLMEAPEQDRGSQRMGVQRLALVADQRIARGQQIRLDVQHAQVVQQAGGRRHGDIVARRPVLPDQMRTQQRHPYRMLEQPRTFLTDQRQLERDRARQRNRTDGLENPIADRRRGPDLPEERRGLHRILGGRTHALAVDTWLDLHAFVQRRRQPMLDQPFVERAIEGRAVFDQLDAPFVENGSRCHHRTAIGKVAHRLEQGGAFGSGGSRVDGGHGSTRRHASEQTNPGGGTTAREHRGTSAMRTVVSTVPSPRDP